MIRVKRSELNTILEPKKHEGYQSTIKEYDVSECYTITKIQSKYGISDRALQQLIKRHGLPKIKKGRYTYVPKILIDDFFQ